MLIEEIVTVAIVGMLIGGFFIVRGFLARPKRTRDELSVVVEAYEKMTLQHERELAVLQGLTKEMASSLILSSGHGPALTANDEHDLHVDEDLRRRRAELGHHH